MGVRVFKGKGRWGILGERGGGGGTIKLGVVKVRLGVYRVWFGGRVGFRGTVGFRGRERLGIGRV